MAVDIRMVDDTNDPTILSDSRQQEQYTVSDAELTSQHAIIEGQQLFMDGSALRCQLPMLVPASLPVQPALDTRLSTCSFQPKRQQSFP